MTKTATVSLHGNSLRGRPGAGGAQGGVGVRPVRLDPHRGPAGRRADGAGDPAPHRAAFAPQSQTRNPLRATETHRHRLRPADRDRACRRARPRRQLRRPHRCRTRSPASSTCSPARRPNHNDGQPDLLLRFLAHAIRPRSRPRHAAPPHRPQRSRRPHRLVCRRTPHRRDHRRGRRRQDRRRARRAGRPWTAAATPSSTCPTPPSGCAASTTASSPPSAGNR